MQYFEYRVRLQVSMLADATLNAELWKKDVVSLTHHTLLWHLHVRARPAHCRLCSRPPPLPLLPPCPRPALSGSPRCWLYSTHGMKGRAEGSKPVAYDQMSKANRKRALRDLGLDQQPGCGRGALSVASAGATACFSRLQTLSWTATSV